MNKYRLEYQGGAWGIICMMVLFLTGILAPFALIVLVNGIVVRQVDPNHPLERTP